MVADVTAKNCLQLEPIYSRNGPLTERLQAAAAAAIADVMPAIEADPRKVRLITIELEVANGCQVVGGTAWIERAVNVGKLLGVGRG